MGVGERGVVDVAEGLDRDLRGDLARLVAAHAVGDHADGFVARDEEVVFVVGPVSPHIGEAGETDAHGNQRGVIKGRRILRESPSAVNGGGVGLWRNCGERPAEQQRCQHKHAAA